MTEQFSIDAVRSKVIILEQNHVTVKSKTNIQIRAYIERIDKCRGPFNVSLFCCFFFGGGGE